MSTKSLQNLLPKILDLTKANKIRWTEEDNNPGTFSMAINNVSLSVYREPAGPSIRYLMALYNSGDSKVESVYQDVKLGDKEPSGPIFELYQLAKRSSLRIDESLDALESGLTEIEKG